MTNTIGEMEMNILMDEALMMNKFRDEFNSRQAEAEKEYLGKSRWSRFVEDVKLNIRIGFKHV